MGRLWNLEKRVREELRERKDEPEDISDIIHEIADGSVPVYTSDLLQLAVDNINLAVEEPELGPAFDGSPTPVNIIAANVYEYLTQVLWDEWRESEEE